jgi:hypothetical protein
MNYLKDVRWLAASINMRPDIIALAAGEVPGCQDRYGNLIYAGVWVIHGMSSGGTQLTQVVSVEEPVRPELPAVIKVRTPRRTWDRTARQYRDPEFGPVRTVATYGVVRYHGNLPDSHLVLGA